VIAVELSWVEARRHIGPSWMRKVPGLRKNVNTETDLAAHGERHGAKRQGPRPRLL